MGYTDMELAVMRSLVNPHSVVNGKIMQHDILLPFLDTAEEDRAQLQTLFDIMEEAGLTLTENIRSRFATYDPDKPGEFGYCITNTRQNYESAIDSLRAEFGLGDKASLTDCFVAARKQGTVFECSIQLFLFRADRKRLVDHVNYNLSAEGGPSYSPDS